MDKSLGMKVINLFFICRDIRVSTYVLVLVCFIQAVDLFGTTHMVMNTSDSGINSLRQTILIAVDGDTIRFDTLINGLSINLNTEIVIDNNLTIIGNGRENTIIDGLGNSRIFTILANRTVFILALAIINGNVLGAGGAIFLAGALFGIDVLFNSNSATVAGAIQNDGFLSLLNCLFLSNSSLLFTAAIVCGLTATAIIASCIFSGNAVALRNAGDVTISKSNFNNNAGISGGAISNLNGGTLRMDECILNSNQALASHGGAIYNYPGANLFLKKTNFSSNVTVGNGGGLYNAGRAEISSCVFANNRATIDGGGIYASDDLEVHLRITRSRLINNRAGINGGGIFLCMRVEVARIRESLCQGNQANSGGGIFVGGKGHITNTICSGNRAILDGGGIFVSSNTDVNISNSTITGNTAERMGGGLNTDAPLSLANTIIALNSSDSDGPDFFDSKDSIIDCGGNLIGDTTGVEGRFTISTLKGSTINVLDPLFIQNVPIDDSTGGDFRLQCTSPAIDAGKDTTGLHLGLYDLDSLLRVMGTKVDIGPYESSADLMVTDQLVTIDTSRQIYEAANRIEVSAKLPSYSVTTFRYGIEAIFLTNFEVLFGAEIGLEWKDCDGL